MGNRSDAIESTEMGAERSEADSNGSTAACLSLTADAFQLLRPQRSTDFQAGGRLRQVKTRLPSSLLSATSSCLVFRSGNCYTLSLGKERVPERERARESRRESAPLSPVSQPKNQSYFIYIFNVIYVLINFLINGFIISILILIFVSIKEAKT